MNVGRSLAEPEPEVEAAADQSAAFQAGFAVLMVASTIVVVFAIYLEFGPGRWPGVKKAANNVMAWIYTLYVVAVLLTAFRAIALETFCKDCNDYFTITYNWAASLIVSISCIVPMRLLEMLKNPMKRVDADNFKTCLLIAVFYVVLLVVSIIMHWGAEVSTKDMILLWRIIFLINVAIEFVTLFRCVAIFKGSRQGKRYYHFVRATVFMRGGITITLILKYVDVVPTEWLKIYHMLFVVLGMVYYNRKLQEKAKVVVSAAASYVKSEGSAANKSQGSGTDSQTAQNTSSAEQSKDTGSA